MGFRKIQTKHCSIQSQTTAATDKHFCATIMFGISGYETHQAFHHCGASDSPSHHLYRDAHALEFLMDTRPKLDPTVAVDLPDYCFVGIELKSMPASFGESVNHARKLCQPSPAAAFLFI